MFLLEAVSCFMYLSHWPQIYYVTKDNQEFLIPCVSFPNARITRVLTPHSEIQKSLFKSPLVSGRWHELELTRYPVLVPCSLGKLRVKFWSPFVSTNIYVNSAKRGLLWGSAESCFSWAFFGFQPTALWELRALQSCWFVWSLCRVSPGEGSHITVGDGPLQTHLPAPSWAWAKVSWVKRREEKDVIDDSSSCRNLHGLNLAPIWSGRYVPHLYVGNCVHFSEKFLSHGVPFWILWPKILSSAPLLANCLQGQLKSQAFIFLYLMPMSLKDYILNLFLV